MNTEDPDIVEMDFPPYVEEQSPFPDVEPDFNFEDNKEEIYLRNTELAKEINARILRIYKSRASSCAAFVCFGIC